MDTHTQKFKVRLGIFIMGGLMIFAIVIFFIGKKQNLFNPVFKITTNFYNVSGLQVGNNVRFSGINVGIVDNIKIINDSTVEVEMLIRKDVQKFIKMDSKASIGSDGIIGDRVMVISQGSNKSPMVKDGQHIASLIPIEFNDILLNLQSAVVSVEIITVELAEIMTNINRGKGTLGMLIQDSTIAMNTGQIIHNLKASSKGVEMVTIELAEIMSNINSKKGTLGMLIKDSATASNINEIIFNLKSTSKGLDENMEAVKKSLLFRGYYRRQDKEKEKAAEEEKEEQLRLQNEP
jgi:phospholipid/cholesterol/gamma-HCH transport system substrate-binding protein